MVRKLFIRTIKRSVGSPLLSPLLKGFCGPAACLMYHSVTTRRPLPDSFAPNHALRVSADRFDEQMRYLSRNCRCISVDEGIDLLGQGNLPRCSVMVTFDDGYRDNLLVALPILEKYKVPATIFVTTGLVERKSAFWWHEVEFILQGVDYLDIEWEGRSLRWPLKTPREKFRAFCQLNPILMGINKERQESLMSALRACSSDRFSYDEEVLSWDEVSTLASHPLISIGSHTDEHLVLSHLPDDKLQAELRGSRCVIETRIGKRVSALGYPFGSVVQVGEREFNAAKEAGYRCAFTTRCGHIFPRHCGHMFALPRIAIDGRDELFHLRWKLCGAEALYQNRGRMFITA